MHACRPDKDIPSEVTLPCSLHSGTKMTIGLIGDFQTTAN